MAGKRVSMADVQHLLGQRVLCTLRSWKDAWGFAVSDSFPGDLFVHKEAVVRELIKARSRARDLD